MKSTMMNLPMHEDDDEADEDDDDGDCNGDDDDCDHDDDGDAAHVCSQG